MHPEFTFLPIAAASQLKVNAKAQSLVVRNHNCRWMLPQWPYDSLTLMRPCA